MFQCIVTSRQELAPPQAPLAARPDIRGQLGEQARLLELRAEGAAGAAAELAEHCRRRAELEAEYARALDKLARAAVARRATLAARRPHVAAAPPAAALGAAADAAATRAAAHRALSACYGGALHSRLQQAAEDAARLHTRCREVLSARQEELLAALGEAGAAHKAAAAAAQAHRAHALKLRHAYDARERAAAAEPSSRKLKALEKRLEKRRARYTTARSRALLAHSDYVLSVAAARAALQRYYVDDVAEILACMETGWGGVLQRAVGGAAAAEDAAGAAAARAAAGLRAHAAAMDAGAERARWLQAHAAAFTPPPVAAPPPPPAARDLLGAAAPPEEEEAEQGAEQAAESAERLVRLRAALRDLRAAAVENHKTLRAAEAELVKQMEGSEAAWALDALAAPPGERDAARDQQEDYYITKFRSYLSLAGRVRRLEAREAALGGGVEGDGGGGDAGGEDDDGDDVPRVVRACVRAIAAHGLRQPGVFRVPGSLGEAAALRAALARGEAARVRGAADVHAVCTLLKQALRQQPPLGAAARARLLALAAADGPNARAALAAELGALPRRSLLTLRYVCGFLAHLARHAAHNMMDAWNLAICVGPTLLAATHVGQQNLANELVKRLIEQHDQLFPQHVAPHALYRPLESDELAAENGDACDPCDMGDAVDAPCDATLRASLAALGAELDATLDASLDDTLDATLDASLDDAPLYEHNDESDDDTEDASDGEDEDWRDDPPLRAGAARASQEESPTQSSSSVNTCARLAEATPDLVLDLPGRAAPPPASPAPPASNAPPAMSAPPAATPPAPPPRDNADHFALNKDTLKKRPPSKSSESSDGAPSVADAAGVAGVAATGIPVAAMGSPVAARNTARMAAKFADLTLTGGARKPTVAAKPALLRRPTPHPAHASPAAPQLPLQAAPQAASQAESQAVSQAVSQASDL